MTLKLVGGIFFLVGMEGIANEKIAWESQPSWKGEKRLLFMAKGKMTSGHYFSLVFARFLSAALALPRNSTI